MESTSVFEELRDILGEVVRKPAKPGKGRGLPPGTIRTWKGVGDVKKTKSGDWVPLRKGGLARKGVAPPKKKAPAPAKKLVRKPQPKKKAVTPVKTPVKKKGPGSAATRFKPAAAYAKPAAPAKKAGPGSAATQFKRKSAYVKPAEPSAGGPEKTKAGRVPGGGAAGAPTRKPAGPSKEPAKPGDFDEPDHERKMRAMFKQLSKPAQDKILAKSSPSDREILTRPEPAPIKLTQPVAPEKTKTGRVPAKSVSPQQAKAVAGQLKKSLGPKWNAFRLPFKRMTDHFKRPEVRDALKNQFKAMIKGEWENLKGAAAGYAQAGKAVGKKVAGAGRVLGFAGKTYAKHLAKHVTPGLYDFASKLSRGHEVSVSDREKALDSLTKLAKSAISTMAFAAATGGKPYLYPEKRSFHQMTDNMLDGPIRKSMEYALDLVQKKAAKKQTSAVEELRSILLGSKKEEADPSDLEDLIDVAVDHFLDTFDVNDADIGSAFHDSGLETGAAQAWASV